MIRLILACFRWLKSRMRDKSAPHKLKWESYPEEDWRVTYRAHIDDRNQYQVWQYKGRNDWVVSRHFHTGYYVLAFHCETIKDACALAEDHYRWAMNYPHLSNNH